MDPLFKCTPRNARPLTVRSANGRRPTGLTVDIHCHVLVPDADTLVKPVFNAQLESVVRFANDHTRAINREQRVKMDLQLTTLPARLADMDRMGIDMQVISPAPNQYFYGVDADVCRSTSCLINDRLAAMAASMPERFVALGTLPMQSPELAVAELRRCMGELGMRGVEISSNVNGLELSDPSLAPFFAAAEELGALIFLHPLGFTHGDRLVRHYMNNVIGNPLESAIAVSHLIFDGVLDRHPGLKICVAHGGGYLPTYAGRMEHAFHAREDCRCHIAKPPSEYLKRLYFDSVVFDRAHLSHLVDVYGAEHLLLGTDYPYDMSESDPLEFLSGIETLDPAQLDAIAGGNAARLLGLVPFRSQPLT